MATIRECAATKRCRCRRILRIQPGQRCNRACTLFSNSPIPTYLAMTASTPNIFKDLPGNGAERAAAAWLRTEGWVHEERPLKAIRKIIVKGACDVLLCRGETPRMVVAGVNQEALDATRTELAGDKLVIDSVFGSTTFETHSGTMSTRTTIHGLVHSVIRGGIAGRDIINIQRGGRTVHVNTGAADIGLVAIVVPSVAEVTIKGSADVALFDLDQRALELKISGSGDIDADGRVDELVIEVSGSGDIDATGLDAQRVDISVAGSGDVDVQAKVAVRARLTGSGDMKIRGNPPERDVKVWGSGDVRFK